jgi:hypothetical protein
VRFVSRKAHLARFRIDLAASIYSRFLDLSTSVLSWHPYQSTKLGTLETETLPKALIITVFACVLSAISCLIEFYSMGQRHLVFIVGILGFEETKSAVLQCVFGANGLNLLHHVCFT